MRLSKKREAKVGLSMSTALQAMASASPPGSNSMRRTSRNLSPVSLANKASKSGTSPWRRIWTSSLGVISSLSASRSARSMGV